MEELVHKMEDAVKLLSNAGSKDRLSGRLGNQCGML